MTKTLPKPLTDRHNLMTGFVIGQAYGQHTEKLKESGLPLGQYGAPFPAAFSAFTPSFQQAVALLESAKTDTLENYNVRLGKASTPSMVQATWLAALDVSLEEKLAIAKKVNIEHGTEEVIAAQVSTFIAHKLINEEVEQGELIQSALDFSADLPETKVQQKLQHAKANLSAFIEDDEWNLNPLVYVGTGKDSAEVLALSLLALDSNPEDEVLALRRAATHEGNSLDAAILTGALLGAAGFDYPSRWNLEVKRSLEQHYKEVAGLFV